MENTKNIELTGSEKELYSRIKEMSVPAYYTGRSYYLQAQILELNGMIKISDHSFSVKGQKFYQFSAKAV